MATVRFDTGPTDDEIWSLTEHVARYLQASLESLDGRVGGPKFDLWDSDGSTISRDSLASLRQAAREHHLTATRTCVSFQYKKGLAPLPPNPTEMQELMYSVNLDLDPDLEVSVWSHFDSQRRPRHLDANLESKDKLLVDGLKARITAERDSIAAHGLQTPIAAAQPRAAASRPASVPSASSPEESPVAATAPSGWLARNWRDHTAVFVVTVVGGLVVVAVATWLGLGG